MHFPGFDHWTFLNGLNLWAHENRPMSPNGVYAISTGLVGLIRDYATRGSVQLGWEGDGMGGGRLEGGVGVGEENRDASNRLLLSVW